VKSEKIALKPEDMAKYTKFMNYIDAHIPYHPVYKPKHIYTIELRKAVFSEELF